MNPSHIQKVVDGHQQKFSDSCCPSLAEMMLKIQGLVSIDYYEEQNRDQNNPVGITNIKDKEFSGWIFREVPAVKSTFLKNVNRLILENKVVGIFLQLDPNQPYHGYVLQELRDENYILLSKRSHTRNQTGRETIREEISVFQMVNYYNRNCIYLEELPHDTKSQIG
jgi:hypothetical protein